MIAERGIFLLPKDRVIAYFLRQDSHDIESDASKKWYFDL
jgi:hypothetical protein